MRIAWALTLVWTLSWHGRLITIASATPACRAAVHPLETLPGRVDSLPATSAAGAVPALVGRPGSR
ncbi:MAG: hypothetical protein ACRDIE_14905, partial [Chloroflexota bacterium]